MRSLELIGESIGTWFDRYWLPVGLFAAGALVLITLFNLLPA